MSRFLAIAVLMLARAASAGDEVKASWPPRGPTWETDPTRAFERARKEEKPVFVYVATDG